MTLIMQQENENVDSLESCKAWWRNCRVSDKGFAVIVLLFPTGHQHVLHIVTVV